MHREAAVSALSGEPADGPTNRPDAVLQNR